MGFDDIKVPQELANTEPLLVIGELPADQDTTHPVYVELSADLQR
jgi:hypothetical protein